MSNYLIVKEDVSLVRDTYSKAILNTNVAELEKHRRKRQAMREHHNKLSKIDSLEQEITEIKSTLSEVTSMLQQLLQKS